MLLGVVLASAPQAHAFDIWWAGDVNNLWDDVGPNTSNWSLFQNQNVDAGNAPSAFNVVRLGTLGASRNSIFLLNDASINGLRVDPGSPAYTISSNRTLFTGASGIVSDSLSTLTLDCSVNATSHLFNLRGGGAIVVTKPLIQSTASLTKTGPGTLFLTAANTYSGPTTINGGTLRLNVNGVTNSGGGTLTGNSPIIINNGATLLGGTTDALGFLNNLSNNSITINPGGTLSVVTGSRLSIDRNVSLIGGTITSQGAGDAAGAFLFRSTQNNTFSATSAPDGTPSTISAQGISLEGVIPFNVTRGIGVIDLLLSSSLSNLPSRTGGISKSGNGIMTLTGANIYTGGTTISAGTLQIGSGGTTGSVVGNITNNAELVFNRSDSFILPGLITGSGSLSKLGTGTLTLAPGQATPYQMSALTIIDGAINTSDNDLIVNYTGTSPLATLNGYAATSQLFASSDFGGIPTLMVFFEAADFGLTSFAGIPVDATTVIGKYTYTGDANLDGQVDAFDYSAIDDNFGTPGTFITGDLNQDGFVDAFDYSNIDDTFGAGVNNPLRPGGYAMSASTEVFIPEPASLSLLALSTGLLLARRRR